MNLLLESVQCAPSTNGLFLAAVGYVEPSVGLAQIMFHDANSGLWTDAIEAVVQYTPRSDGWGKTSDSLVWNQLFLFGSTLIVCLPPKSCTFCCCVVVAAQIHITLQSITVHQSSGPVAPRVM